MALMYLAQTVFVLPSATIFPFSIHTARVQKSSTAEIPWDTNTTVFPLLIMFMKAVLAFAENVASPVLSTSSTNIMSASTWSMIEKASLPDIPEE